jgi:exodeoxyribonuclease-1
VQDTFYWHDYETFGANPARDRPSQFAGLRTDFELNIVGDPLVIYCQPQRDILPSPEACMVTGITPQQAMEKGLPEPQFMAQIYRELSTPHTCGVGYNSIRFDDEVTRYGLYRNFYDPYQREWQNGNSRWDVIDLMRITRALRPQGIEWPDHEPGSPSFKLEHLTEVNGIEHSAAHDALSDVTATLGMAKLVKELQPKLFNYVLSHRSKPAVAKIVNVASRKPFFHCSGMLSKAHLYSAVMMPLAPHPSNSNGIICYDLSADPEPLIKLDCEEIKHRLFTPSDQLAKGTQRVPLKVIHLNKAPVVSTVNVVDSTVSKRLDIDMQRVEQNWQALLDVDLQSKLQRVFTQSAGPSKGEAEQQLYQNFLPQQDKPLLDQIRAASSDDLRGQTFCFSDSRYNQMLFNYRARFFPETLSSEDQAQWVESCRWRLSDEESGYLTLDQHKSMIEVLLSDVDLSQQRASVLEALLAWNASVAQHFALNPS